MGGIKVVNFLVILFSGGLGSPSVAIPIGPFEEACERQTFETKKRPYVANAFCIAGAPQ